MINISNIKDSYLSCFEHPLALCLRTLGLDYRIFFMTSWNFSDHFLVDFTDTKSNIEMSLKLDSIQHFLGIEFEYYQNKSLMLESVKKQIDNKKTVIAHMNSVYCSWLTSYHSDMPTHHYVLIIGYTEHSLLCMDMNSINPETMFYDDFVKGCEECMFYSENRHTPEAISAQSIHNYLSKFSSNDYSMYSNIKQFSYYIEKEFDIRTAIKGYEPFKYAPFFTWIKGISTSRMNYKRFLELMIQKHILMDEYTLVLEGLNNIYKKWYHIIMCLIRCVYCNDTKDKMAVISKDISAVADLENEVLFQLKNRLTKEYY